MDILDIMLGAKKAGDSGADGIPIAVAYSETYFLDGAGEVSIQGDAEFARTVVNAAREGVPCVVVLGQLGIDLSECAVRGIANFLYVEDEDVAYVNGSFFLHASVLGISKLVNILCVESGNAAEGTVQIVPIDFSSLITSTTTD